MLTGRERSKRAGRDEDNASGQAPFTRVTCKTRFHLRTQRWSPRESESGKQPPGSWKAHKFRRTHPTSEGRGGAVTEGLGGGGGRRGAAPHHTTSLANDLIGYISDTANISGNIRLLLEEILHKYGCWISTRLSLKFHFTVDARIL